ncbi:DUF3817 domain-containing protein [Nocardioides sp. CFH 31398]|uniref:DUF3817 domain-containing protein n=1 Tax=Nocardioides sp. CFH 31398 TaxID=2919579 RepID=UPI001F0543F5|nr:DUF3817 domain-containing protein [Nocardioides sp. CFH 31398]MCH1865680.1 DUF3817 domain-containing protein [Nocardioides sp. CFH 31398]
MRGALLRYRVMASVVGVLLVVLFFVSTPLSNFDGSSMWGFIPVTPDWVTPGSPVQEFGAHVSEILGVAHGWLYMIFLVCAFLLARRAGWDLPFTLVTLVMGTVPVLSFWAEHRATRRVRAEHADELATPARPPAA